MTFPYYCVCHFLKIGCVIVSSSNLRLLKKYKFSYYSEQIWKETGWDSEICHQKELRVFAPILALKEIAKFPRLYSTLLSSNPFQFSSKIKGFKIVNMIPSSPTHTHSLALQHSSNKIQKFKIVRWQLKPLTYWPELTSQISFHVLTGMMCSGSHQPPLAPLRGEI